MSTAAANPLDEMTRRAAAGEAPAPFALAFKCLGFVVQLSVAADPEASEAMSGRQ